MVIGAVGNTGQCCRSNWNKGDAKWEDWTEKYVSSQARIPVSG